LELVENSVRSAALRDFCRRTLVALGVPEAHAAMAGDSLAAANLRGVDSHGLQMLLPFAERLAAGGMDAPAVGRVI
jgi:LDH2 family malate/lactate/ureidoglycolate dehydrogenase